jgi:hemerythrin-like domain-containing protein
MFLGTLGAVAEVIDRRTTAEVRGALESALRYFREAAPKHTGDEEKSLFPRLRQVADSDVRPAVAILDKLETEHRRAYPLHAEVERIGEKYLADGSLSSQEVDRFRRAVQDLHAMYERHISVEDEIIFPLAARVLSQHQKSAIAEEMAERRKVKLVGIARGK